MRLQTDEIGFGGYRLMQDADAFRYGVDAVLLADFAAPAAGDRVCDLCCGTGVIPLILHAKYRPASLTGVELQQQAWELAVKNAADNGLTDRMRFIRADVTELKEILSAGSFDLVTCNPPYFEKGRGPECEADAKHIARHETTAGLRDFMEISAWLLRAGGELCMIHRPSRLTDLFVSSRQCGLEPKCMRLVAPHAGESPNLVLLRFVKGGGKELKILPQLVIREKDGSYTPELTEIYR